MDSNRSGGGEAGPGRGLSILLVEDEAAIRSLAREFLVREGHRVAEAANLREARARLASGTYEVLLVDLTLPDGDGGAFAAEAAAQRPGLRCVLMSGGPSARSPGEGGFRFLAKPYRSADLLGMLGEDLPEAVVPRPGLEPG